jgi:hypothetical protein
MAVAYAGRAWAQAQVVTGSDVQVGYQGLPSKAPQGTESGVQVSDGVLMHLGVGAEAGYDSNVFFRPSDLRSSPLVRIVPFVELTNATRSGAVPSGMFFDLGASLTYREYLSSDPGIRDQRAVMPGANATLEFSSTQAMTFTLSDSYNRSVDPPYVANAQPYTRDTNQAMGQLRWAPGGGRLATALRYTNTIDYFETDVFNTGSPTGPRPNSVSHDLMLDASWKWLPKTALFVTIHQGYISYFSGANKVSSYPLRALAGLRGLITSKLTLNLAAGYGNGFYQAGPSPSGVRGGLVATAELMYRPTIESAVVLGYRHDFQNSILGNFYYLDALYLNFSQAIAGRLALGLSGRYESRSFQGIQFVGGAVVDRHDNYWQVGANLDYHMRAWTYVGVAYTLMKNDTDSSYMPPNIADPGPVNYVKHLLFARLGVAY